MDAAQALGNLPQSLRAELLEEYAKIVRNYRESRWEAAELNGGRFCEIVFTILEGHLDGDNFADKATKPARFNDACKRLENSPTTYSDSARLTIPRVLVALYDVRNRRGVGHVGGEVDANHMDATFVLHMAQWVMAELVRLFHATDVTTATKVVDALVDRTLPVIWEVGGAKRILDTSLTLQDSTLLLLYSEPAGMGDRDLARHLEQGRIDNYRRVLRRLHAERKIEYDARACVCVISPRGMKDVEERLLGDLDL